MPNAASSCRTRGRDALVLGLSRLARIRSAQGILLSLCIFALVLTPSVRMQERSRPRTVTLPPQGPVVYDDPKEQPPSVPPKSFATSDASKNQSQQSQVVDEDEVVKITTSEVLLPVTVRDASGQLVTNLTRTDFRVVEEGRVQPLNDLALRQVPVDVVLMVDSSSSVAANVDDFRRAAEEFSERIAVDDRLSLIKFDDRVELLLDWTRSRSQLRRALRRITPGIFTRFNDALVLAAREQFNRDQRRHAVVVLTDGIDSGRGAATLEAALKVMLERQIAVYVISNTEIERARKRAELDNLLGGTDSSVRFNELRIGDLREGLRVLAISEQNLTQLTRATGGRLYKPESFSDLSRVYSEIAEELRHQYALYFTPLKSTRDGRFRRVVVEVPTRSVQVTTRIGYFAPSS